MHSAVPVVSRRRVQRHAPRLTRRAACRSACAPRSARTAASRTLGGRVNCYCSVYCIILLSSLRGRAPAGGAGGSGLVRARIAWPGSDRAAFSVSQSPNPECEHPDHSGLVCTSVAGRSRRGPRVSRGPLRPVRRTPAARHTRHASDDRDRVSSGPGRAGPACPRACRRARRPPRPGAPEHGPRPHRPQRSACCTARRVNHSIAHRQHNMLNSKSHISDSHAQ